jgi:hypothetical protein
MAYRDDREALRLQVMELERENESLREELRNAAERHRRLRLEQYAARQSGSRRACMTCGGVLLPVAVFAGHDNRAPLPLSMSTLRFGLATGGFTHSAPVHSMACSSCGLIHSFVDIEQSERSDDAEPQADSTSAPDSPGGSVPSSGTKVSSGT